jgi:hypothetical protein
VYLSIKNKMAQQNINQYVFKKFYLDSHFYDLNDISLASDELDFNQEVVFSPYLIAQTYGNRLPFYFDLNSLSSNQRLSLSYGEYNFNNVLISENYYNPNGLDLTCFSSETLCDIGLTGIDNGLVTGMTGQTITITQGLFSDSDKFGRYNFDRRLKLTQVTGYTSSPNVRFSGISAQTIYEIVSKIDPYIGYYQELYGGFYQGFYKLFGYDYDLFPSRMNKGWSVEMIIKPRLTNEFSATTGQTTLNEIYPDNRNMFFYMGTRAENKYGHHANGVPSSDTGYTRVTESLADCLKTCACSNTGVTNSRCVDVYEPTGITVSHAVGCGCGCNSGTISNIPDKDPIYDSMSNAISLRLCGEDGNPKIGVRILRFTGDCETTGSCETSGITYSTGYTIDNYCSPNGIYDYCLGVNSAYTTSEHWFLVDVVWERYTWLDTCDLYFRGGLGDITKLVYLDSLANNSVYLISPPVTHQNLTPEQIEIVQLNEKWLIDKHYRNGRLKIYVNGRIFYTIEDVEEIIPRALNADKEKQIGVPFNISWGGGTQGLRENLVFSACPTGLTNSYIQDPELFPNNVLSATSLSSLTTNILIEQNFAGTFEGGISQFRMYVSPLTAPEVKHNFLLLKDKFDMFNPDCPKCYPVCDTNDITYNLP